MVRISASYQTQRVTWPTGLTSRSAHGHRRSIKGEFLFALQDFYSLTHGQDGVFDNSCMKLAKLYNQAVDYAKKGVPVDIGHDFPRPLIKFKPDWNKAEVTGARELDYYESDRALGYLYRNIRLINTDEPADSEDAPDTTPKLTPPLKDMISQVIAPYIQHTLDIAFETPEAESAETEELYGRFLREMRYVCITHTLLDSPDVHLTEEEVVLGVILAKSSQPRLRKDRMYRMRLHVETLVRDIRARIIAPPAEDGHRRTNEDFRDGLRKAWATWGWAQHHRDKEYIESFSFIALAVALDCLKQLGALPDS
jgi:RNA-dependent RNA polymerase